MLTLTKKQYEIEEDIILNDENNNEIYKFKMQLNADELKQLQEALIGKNTLKKAKQIQSFEDKNLTDEQIDNVMAMVEELPKNLKVKEINDIILYWKLSKMGLKNKKEKVIKI